eukprot:7282197-Prymnesium_polylepis.1
MALKRFPPPKAQEHPHPRPSTAPATAATHLKVVEQLCQLRRGVVARLLSRSAAHWHCSSCC